MLCTDNLSIVCSYVQDWRSVVLMSTVCKEWKTAVTMYAGSNVLMDRGQYRRQAIYKLLVYYPSYLTYMYETCRLPYLGKIMNITQSRCDKRYIRMSFGKFKGRLVVKLFYDYRRWLKYNCKDKYIVEALSRPKSTFKYPWDLDKNFFRNILLHPQIE